MNTTVPQIMIYNMLLKYIHTQSLYIYIYIIRYRAFKDGDFVAYVDIFRHMLYNSHDAHYKRYFWSFT